jgi:hypothetical protein
MDKRLAAHYAKAKQAAMAELTNWLDRRFREEITSPEWDFPTPPTVRDIVNTGRLRDSQEHTTSPEDGIRFTWSAPYAAQVHEGGVGLNGQRFPGRPWTTEPLAEMPAKFAEMLAKHLAEGTS